MTEPVNPLEAACSSALTHEKPESSVSDAEFGESVATITERGVAALRAAVDERKIVDFGETIPREMYEPKPGELGLVRALGFDNWYGGPDGGKEEMFFVGPSGERADHCNESAAREFIAHYERAIETMKLYLLNGRNRRTHEWTVRTVSAPEKIPVQP